MIGAGFEGPALGVIVVLVLTTGVWFRSILLAIFAVALLGGSAAEARNAPGAALPDGRAEFAAVAISDTVGSVGAQMVVVSVSGTRVAVRGSLPAVAVGEHVEVAGRLRGAVFRTRWGWVTGVVEDPRLTVVGGPDNPLLRVGNRLRQRVLGQLTAVVERPGGALLAGFLIGDTSRLAASDAEALRLSGLSHFVAVSGSNVALFLGAWWLASGPLGWRPRRRALIGLVGLVVFVVVTRWEPSVLRASVMAAVVLIGRMRGVWVSPWQALGWAVTVLVLVSGDVVGQIGFQLSVAATAGIIAGIPLWRGRTPLWFWGAIGATLSAQAAVAPLLLFHFGSVPLLAPLTNMVAAPLVALATMLGGVGTMVGWALPVSFGADVAHLVLEVARAAADGTQLGVIGTVLAMGVGGSLIVAPHLRSAAAVIGCSALLLFAVPSRPPAAPVVHFLDVGQGDATLLRGSRGEVILVDGGPDPARLRAHLRRHGVRRIDLLVISHRHADHTAGLVGTDVPIRLAWYPPHQTGHGGAFDEVLADLVERAVPAAVPVVGERLVVGEFVVEVLGPVRRYASPNDGSLVLRVTGAGTSVLLPGDIETFAQTDLGPLPSDILKVPHQGAATSDAGWLTASAPRWAIVSVGPNDFGHPSGEVIAVLESAGAVVRRTDRDGTVTLRLDRLAAERAPLPSSP